jgi:ParB/RepB/Spo0J family partition protein
MTSQKGSAKALLDIEPDRIRANKDNPRIIFRENEMQELLDSIAEVGIQVPVTVYEDHGYVILDGERRWRCSKKLNMRTIPCIVHPKPTPLENLLMMFNIHNVRVQWDIMPTAYKLGEVRDMLAAVGRDHSPKTLATITGVRLPTVKRCLELLELPRKYRDMLMEEAEKPKGEQRITPDLFIEINKAFNVVESYVPECLESFDKKEFVSAMVDKYQAGAITGVIEFRQISKMARAELAGVARDEAIPAISKLVSTKGYSIQDAYHDTVESAYERRDIVAKVDGLRERVLSLKSSALRAPELRAALVGLRDDLIRLLK